MIIVCGFLTFITVPHSVEVDIVVVMAEEEEGEPWVKWVNGDNEQYPDDPSLLIGTWIEP